MNIFEIHKISWGWFEVCFTPHGEKQGFLTNSDYLQCDAPALFLDALANLSENKSREEWLCWQDEPGAYVLHIGSEGANILVGIYYSKKDSLDLPYSGAELAEDLDELVYSQVFKIHDLLDDVLTEFSLYENGNGLRLYNAHWGDFPQKEYHRLRQCAASFDKTLGKYDKMFCFSY